MPEPTSVNKYRFKSLKEIQDCADNDTSIRNVQDNSIDFFKSIKLLEKLYDKAVATVEEDEENAFLLFRKFWQLFANWRIKFQKDKTWDEKYVQITIAAKVKKAFLQCQALLENLEKRYEEQSAINNVEKIPDKSTAAATIPKLPQTTSIKNGHYSGSTNGVDSNRQERISITCDELYTAAGKKVPRAFLIIDVRLKEEFIKSRIDTNKVSVDLISVPEEMIQPSLTPAQIETKLEEPFATLFKSRGEYGQVVILDWYSTEKEFALNVSSPINLMSSRLKKYDLKVKYKNKPVILDGGYHEWKERYPAFVINCNVTPPPRKKIYDNRIPIDDINYPINALLEPEEVKKEPTTPAPPQEPPKKPDPSDSDKSKPPTSSLENGIKPKFDRSTKPTLQEKQPDTSVVKENGVVPQEKKPIPEQTIEQKPIIKNENSVPEKRVESFEEDEEELKNKCARNGRRSALTSLSNQPISMNNNNNNNNRNSIDSDEDFDASFRDEEKENRMNAMKNARLSVYDETNSNLKRYSSTPNISKLENEYSKPTIDRTTKPSNDDQINIYTMLQDRKSRGLRNLGNTCYMNSILQCLSHTDHLRINICLLSEKFSNPKSKTRGWFAREVRNIIKQLWQEEHGSVSCQMLKNMVGEHRESFRGNNQQDSHEFLTILIDWLHEDLNEPQPVQFLKGADERSGEKAWGEFCSKNNSKIRQYFYGQQKSTVSCNICEKESVTFEPFSNLSLPIPSSTENCSLYQCLRLYTSNEHITGWQCPACKSPRSATKKLDITRLPPYLVIHFKRFTSDGHCEKRSTNVDFPDKLDMSSYIIGKEHRNRKFELYAVSNHIGSMNHGHYTAYCRNSANKTWYKCDDDYVNEMDSNRVVSQSAYIVFYQCVLGDNEPKGVRI
ncbi:ubiquitin carboxyl-terminal hydrolase 8-like isoform X2 [Planococcus citri]|uniref:ubiquitin carboxyl-terminal hydrolase 8-like isoform X2 n=1 Tax=Planococcus citri TaxID=170843 RepID=UPI0031F9EEE4